MGNAFYPSLRNNPQSNCLRSIHPANLMRQFGARAGRAVSTGRGRGFTLIELLVVISVIALLMAILMPALSKIRRHAKETICRQRLSVWGKFLATYLAGSDQILPKESWFVMPSFAKVGRHFDEPDIMFCPLATRTDVPQPYKAWPFFKNYGLFGSYGQNF